MTGLNLMLKSLLSTQERIPSNEEQTMTARTTFDAVSTAGHAGSKQKPTQPNTNRGRWFRKTLTFTPVLVSTTDEQNSGIFLPARCVITDIYIDRIIAATGGATQDLSVGTVGTFATSLFAAEDVSATGIIRPDFIGGITAVAINDPIDELTYTLSDAGWTAWDGEVVIEYMGTDETD